MKKLIVGLTTLCMSNICLVSYAGMPDSPPAQSTFRPYVGIIATASVLTTKINTTEDDQSDFTEEDINLFNLFGGGGGLDAGFIDTVSQHFSYGFEAYYIRQSTFGSVTEVENDRSANPTIDPDNGTARFYAYNVYGVSFLPYYFFNPQFSAFWRLGVIAEKMVSNINGSIGDDYNIVGINQTLVGPQVGFGLSDDLTRHLNLRLEYDFAVLLPNLSVTDASDPKDISTANFRRLYDNRAVLSLNDMF